MDILLEQSFETVLISTYKNYCHLSQKGVNVEIMEDVFHLGHWSSPTYQYETILQSAKRNLVFFHSPSTEHIILEHFPSNTTYFHVKKQRQINRHMNNPFSSMTITRFKRNIRRDGDKILIKHVKLEKVRAFNHRFFKKDIDSMTLVFNLKTGNVTTSTVWGHIKKSRKIRVNCFSDILKFTNKFFKNFGGEDLTEYEKIFNDTVFFEKLREVLGFKEFTNVNDFYEQILDFFISNKKIKTPDNYYNLLTQHYPTEKYLKRNNRKLMSAILDRWGLKSDLNIKIFHKNPKIDLSLLVGLKKIFGDEYEKYAGNIRSEHFDVSSSDLQLSTHEMRQPHIRNISDKEKQNVLKILNNCRGIDFKILSLIEDHFYMISKLKPHFPDISLKSNTYLGFMREHDVLVEKTHFIRKESLICYDYDKKIVEKLEEPISVGNTIFYPKILKTEQEYYEEGVFMSHCVLSYVGRENSMVISIRLMEDERRVTSEYNVVNGVNSQSRFFKNQPPPLDFTQPLEVLNERVKILHKQKTLKCADIKYEKNGFLTHNSKDTLLFNLG